VNTIAGSASLQASAPRPASATQRLHVLMRQRETLRPLFASAWDHLAARFEPADLEAWAAAVLALADVNAGPSCLIAFWNLSNTQPSAQGVSAVIAAAHTAADICRHAGAAAATAAIAAHPIAQMMLGLEPLPRWWRIMGELARQAPESVEAAASHTGEILSAGSLDGFANFVAAGMKAASGDKKRRLAFFSLRDELARRLVERAAGAIGFAEVESPTKAFVTALWGTPPLLRSLAVDGGQAPQRRASIAGPLIRLPEFYRGVQGAAARALYKAAAAHAQAHLRYGGPRFAVKALKPLQVALVTLIEDARIERLAMRALPGLRRLWSPYHTAVAAGIATAPVLLARLARALFDPSYRDDDGFVRKGRDLFDAALPRIDDPAISREIGMLLGNDLGQMRVQFNAKTYVVEPVYRDDGFGLWDFGDNAPSPGEVLELSVDAARVEQKDDPEQDLSKSDATIEQDAIGRARPTAPDRRGTVIAKYPEWDRAHNVERPDWTTVREVPAQPGDPRLVEDAVDAADILRNRISRLVRSVRVGRTHRLKRQLEGHDLDVDAMLEAGISLRMRQTPDPRIFRSTTSGHRDLAVLLLIDISESTRDRLKSGISILDVERLGVAVLAEAMSALGDPFCLLAFASDGRDDVRMIGVKTFKESYDRACVGRLAGLTSGLSTRLGAALRHAGESISQINSFRKLVIVLTDGEPSDIDVADPLDLVEDARRAAIGLRARGIDGFGVVLDRDGMSAAARIFGPGNTMLVHRVEDLPGRLSELYFRLARR
jgi:nitric oxide reductase NorD protein